MVMDKQNNFQALRRRAEEYLNGQDQPEAPRDAEGMRRLIHDLHVHQIKLELQNEELLETQQHLLEAKREAENLRDSFSRLYNEAPTGYLTVSSSGMICLANATLAKMLNADHAAMAGQPLQRWVDPRDREMFLARFKRFFANPDDKSIQLRLVPESGEPFHVELEGRRSSWSFDAPLDGRHHDSDYLLILVHDITPLVKAGEEMRQAKEKAEEATRIKDKFITLVAHDLRAPLASIISLLEYLPEEVELGEEHQELVSVACGSGTGPVEQR